MSNSISIHSNGSYTARAGSGDEAGSVTHTGEIKNVSGLWEKTASTFTNLRPSYDHVKVNQKTDLFKNKDDASAIFKPIESYIGFAASDQPANDQGLRGQ